MQILALLNQLHSGRKSYITGIALILLGVGVVTEFISPEAARQAVISAPATFESIDEKLKELKEAESEAPRGDNTLIGLISLLLGSNAMAQRAAIKKLERGAQSKED